MYLLPHKKPRPSFEERAGRIIIGLSDINRYIARLEIAYTQTKNEYVFAVLNDLLSIKAQVWAEEDKWRKADEDEAFLYFDQLPESVRWFLVDERLR